MNIRECPRCRQHSLVPTGAFWACASCGYAITGFALAVELRVASRREAAARITAAEKGF
jgi:ribosomal protein L37AE/L43A